MYNEMINSIHKSVFIFSKAFENGSGRTEVGKITQIMI